MKSLVESINENVNESLTTISLIAATTFFSAMMMVGAAASNANDSSGDFDPRSPWQVI